ncbi:phosphoribosyltransferase [Aetokthonos hydrillicola Thurmond2011]|jgi:predicted phosphoribosyltransferase|uniref:Phosphoribosyltransferase n=1 Tax=Aetokthonos hydrillicola Thurmond2011 TaxID=2712845 RepID=A0AAP5I4P5_9CYAN|nr:phosphoribosyltransferase family protein [Aetokthonos hydrillicola]MBO3457401.1 phosphoribosyltransferase [Aetokthonos hydrillicola CCALA 1050]MBW4589458.1 phosphoribosyltransferase [Aetokthonos hydrillicola CCALA 1050]MDR9893697.1 phosphoribosyltransferase [Aetokthonos hydrillicola Thurmond2011]
MPSTALFADRTQAGEKLALAIRGVLTEQTAEYGKKPRTIVYALPRGGLPVAAPIARLLNCPLTVEVAKKISHPENPELAIGAVTASGNVLWDEYLFRNRPNLPWRSTAINTAINKAKLLEEQLSPACPQVSPEGATLILVDDGVATGMTIAVAATALRKLSPAEVWLCAPVVPFKLLPWLRQWGDRLIFLQTPESFLSVSHFYLEFPQVETTEARKYLEQQNQPVEEE